MPNLVTLEEAKEASACPKLLPSVGSYPYPQILDLGVHLLSLVPVLQNSN
jgi:hypothetical protein